MELHAFDTAREDHTASPHTIYVCRTCVIHSVCIACTQSCHADHFIASFTCCGSSLGIHQHACICCTTRSTCLQRHHTKAAAISQQTIVHAPTIAYHVEIAQKLVLSACQWYTSGGAMIPSISTVLDHDDNANGGVLVMDLLHLLRSRVPNTISILSAHGLSVLSRLLIATPSFLCDKLNSARVRILPRHPHIHTVLALVIPMLESGSSNREQDTDTSMEGYGMSRILGMEPLDDIMQATVLQLWRVASPVLSFPQADESSNNDTDDVVGEVMCPRIYSIRPLADTVLLESEQSVWTKFCGLATVIPNIPDARPVAFDTRWYTVGIVNAVTPMAAKVLDSNHSTTAGPLVEDVENEIVFAPQRVMENSELPLTPSLSIVQSTKKQDVGTTVFSVRQAEAFQRRLDVQQQQQKRQRSGPQLDQFTKQLSTSSQDTSMSASTKQLEVSISLITNTPTTRTIPVKIIDSRQVLQYEIAMLRHNLLRNTLSPAADVVESSPPHVALHMISSVSYVPSADTYATNRNSSGNRDEQNDVTLPIGPAAQLPIATVQLIVLLPRGCATAYAIDPLAIIAKEEGEASRPEDALKPLASLLLDPRICKLMHNASEAIMWFQQCFGLHIVNVFDTFTALDEGCLAEYLGSVQRLQQQEGLISNNDILYRFSHLPSSQRERREKGLEKLQYTDSHCILLAALEKTRMDMEKIRSNEQVEQEGSGLQKIAKVLTSMRSLRHTVRASKLIKEDVVASTLADKQGKGEEEQEMMVTCLALWSQHHMDTIRHALTPFVQDAAALFPLADGIWTVFMQNTLNSVPNSATLTSGLQRNPNTSVNTSTSHHHGSTFVDDVVTLLARGSSTREITVYEQEHGASSVSFEDAGKTILQLLPLFTRFHDVMQLSHQDMSSSIAHAANLSNPPSVPSSLLVSQHPTNPQRLYVAALKATLVRSQLTCLRSPPFDAYHGNSSAQAPTSPPWYSSCARCGQRGTHFTWDCTSTIPLAT